ncbi:MAG: type II secretion system protein [Phycisphaerae bacterium]|nr:type II secretion system protein [Phycisphaerae bacterium]
MMLNKRLNLGRKENGFTLIELLVVIAIISLLLSVMLPSLNRAKQQAESIYCQSNLRQMMIAAVVYTENNNGFFPIAYYTWHGDNETIQYNWDFTLRTPAPAALNADLGVVDPLTLPDAPAAVTVEPGLLWQGETIDKIHQCPSFRGASNTAYDPYTGYNYNTSYIGHGQWETITQPARRDRMAQLASTAVFGDGQSTNGANKFMRAPLRSEGDLSFSGRYAGAQGFRHNRRTNVAWADGSVSSSSDISTHIDPARHQQILEDYNLQNLRSPIGFLSPDNSAYKTR